MKPLVPPTGSNELARVLFTRPRFDDPDLFLGDAALRPDPMFMALRVIASAVGRIFHRDIDDATIVSTPDRKSRPSAPDVIRHPAGDTDSQDQIAA